MSEHLETVEPFTESELARSEALTAGVEASEDDVLLDDAGL